MKFALPVIGVALLIAAGCQQTSKPAENSSSLDVSPSSPMVGSAPAPAVYNPPAPVATEAPDTSGTISAGVTPAGGSSYTIKHGDTLWKIAATHYGDGRKWKEIVGSNPGLEPSKLKVGQTISLP